MGFLVGLSVSVDYDDTLLWALYAIGANFTTYQELKKVAHKYQPELTELPSYQHMIIGLISGAMGPFSNAPIDTIKTRKSRPPKKNLLYIQVKHFTYTYTHTHSHIGLQKTSFPPGTPTSSFDRIRIIALEMWRQEGTRSFYKGITPRVLRVAPGQAVVFAVYERVRRIIEGMGERQVGGDYTE